MDTKELHYSDILLQPKKSVIDSRLEADTTIEFGGIRFALPIVPANMKTVINKELAVWLAKNGYFYIMHRFGTDPVEFTRWIHKEGYYASVSVGVNDDSLRFISQLADLDSSRPEFITIDIAHGHCDKMERTILHTRKYLPNTFIIAGNVCTLEGAQFLFDAGANGIKVGIGSGASCTTKLMTGFSRPQFSALLSASKCTVRSGKPLIIADGGIEYAGDIAKALVGGANLVMAGYFLAGFEESPGKKIIHDDGRITKEYYGSASEANKAAKEFVEGRRIEIPYRGSIIDRLKEIKESLRSSISYAGGRDLNAFKSVSWVIQ
jgi:GMP reductase